MRGALAFALLWVLEAFLQQSLHPLKSKYLAQGLDEKVFVLFVCLLGFYQQQKLLVGWYLAFPNILRFEENSSILFKKKIFKSVTH